MSMSDTIYQQVTASIIEAMRAGRFEARAWVKSGMPRNAITGREYSGINTLILGIISASNGWDNRWLTYKQAKASGMQVKKGEKGARVVFFKPWEVKDKNNPDAEGKFVPVLRQFVVFNAHQIDGMPPAVNLTELQPENVREALCTASAQAMLNRSGAKITESGDRAFYRPSTDEIYMPEKERFSRLADWYATALHELVHWTGHQSRLNRKEAFKRYDGAEAYAREELVAELGSAFLAANTGFDGLVQQHASYLDFWLKILEHDSRAIFRAAAMAQKACDFIYGSKSEPAFDDNAVEAIA
jgi:antirestriction protein ArdC